jgi:putative SOS response-associated peptidase YedK
MCFFVGIQEKPEFIGKRYQRKADPIASFTPKAQFNGFAFPAIPLVCNDIEALVLGHWGLLPIWQHDRDSAKFTLNARLETVHEKPSFKNVVQHRCLIPVTCFYEWRHEGNTKRPYTIQSSEQALFSLAGLYSDWPTNDGQLMRTFTILTTAANPLMQHIHNTQQRMPVVLKQADEAAYLSEMPLASFAFPYEAPLIAF